MSLQPACLRRSAAAVMLVAVSVLCLTAGSAFAATHHRVRRVRVGDVPTLPPGTTPLAVAARPHRMSLTIALRPRNQRAMDRYASGVSNPRSPYYHHYLTTAGFRQRFGPTARTVNRVERSLRRHGLTPGALNPDGLGLRVRASSAAIERAFSIRLARVRTAAGRDVTYATRAPAFDSNVAHSVQAVVGLNGFVHETPQLLRRPSSPNPLTAAASARAKSARPHVVTGGPQPSSSCTGLTKAATGGAMTADQIANAYGFSGLYHHGDFGRGVTVALYELERNSTYDIAQYQRCYGTNAKVSYVKVGSGAGGSTTGQGEAALDIEQVIGLAPRAHILVYRGPNNGNGAFEVLAEIVNQDRASVVSTSWGACEHLIGSYDASAEASLFTEAAIQGQSVFAAAGDAGSSDCYAPPYDVSKSLAVDDPGSQPFVTSVGGTRITQASPSLTETVWNQGANSSGASAGGGGVSDLWKMPSYQSRAAWSVHVIRSGISTQRGCGPTSSVPNHPYCREVPDVSANADPRSGYLIYFNGRNQLAAPSGWQVIGGTSAASPLWAALVADANSSSACRAPIGFANGVLYHLASQSESTYFHDVTSGNNDALNAHGGLFAAATGYDMASGLGTPVASSLGPAMCTQDVTMSTPGSRRTFRGQRVRLQLHAKLGTGLSGPLHYGSRHLPPGLKLNTSTGKITGRPRRVGVRVVTVDAYANHQIYGSARFVWRVQGRPQVRRVSLTRALSGRPRLAFTVTAGRREPSLRTIKVQLPRGLGPTAMLPMMEVLNKHRYFVRRRVSHRGRTITVHLSRRMRKLMLVLDSGTLYATRQIRHDALRLRPKRVHIVVTPIDAAGGRLHLHRSIRPRP